MHLDTRLAQYGNRQDPVTGAVSTPIHHATTFSHPGFGQSTGFDYSRSANPTRKVLEEAIADAENGARGFAFSSGMAAVSAVLGLFEPGDHLIASDDLYGGTYRLFEQILRRQQIDTEYVDTSDLDKVRRTIRKNTKGIFIETPTNPTMKITDIAGCAAIAREHGVLSIVDNTFMTPYYQRPIDFGADIVLHSASKFLGGHNDVIAGLVVTKEKSLGERIFFLQNAIGAILGPQDCWLLLRGMKTLALRMDRHQQNTLAIAKWLHVHPLVSSVYFPGLPSHPGMATHEKQATGHGGMVSFDVCDERMVEPLLSSVRLITFAESLGGVESLITFPVKQTHADIPKEVRDACGVTDRLLRLSVGIEHTQDLLDDLAQALDRAKREALL